MFASLNGRKPELFIDPNVDLMKVPRGSGIDPWVLPLTNPIPETPWTLPIERWREHIDVPELKFLNPKAVADQPHSTDKE